MIISPYQEAKGQKDGGMTKRRREMEMRGGEIWRRGEEERGQMRRRGGEGEEDKWKKLKRRMTTHIIMNFKKHEINNNFTIPVDLDR